MSFVYDSENLESILTAAQTAALQFLESLATRPAGRSPELLPHDSLPEEGLGAMQALSVFRTKYEALLSGSPGPRYLGFVTGGSTPAAIAGDWLVSAYDQNVGSDGDSIATTAERETLGLLRALFVLPEYFEGAFVSGATQANLVALATARQWAAQRLGIDVSEEGLWNLPRIPVLSGAPHVSILKVLSILGMGRQSVESIPCLPGRSVVDVQALGERLAALDGKPAIVVASAGEVNTGDFDDIVAVARLCQ